MNPVYILLLPLSCWALYNKVVQVAGSAKAGNQSRLKADVFFLVLTVFLILCLVLLIEST